MPRYLVNLGSAVTVEAVDEAEALQKAKTSPDVNYFHMQVQKLLDPVAVDAARFEEQRLLNEAAAQAADEPTA